MMLMMAFENEGLSTGYCQCIMSKQELADELNITNPIELMIGIGYRSDDIPDLVEGTLPQVPSSSSSPLSLSLSLTLFLSLSLSQTHSCVLSSEPL